MNKPCLFENMQSAVDIVLDSLHETSKVAATLIGEDDSFTITRTNFWPLSIVEHLGTQTQIGNASGTIHAETAVILAAAASRTINGTTKITTKGASIFITDPPCPNCMKNIAEAGIIKLYIDHKGFAKDFAQRRGDDFENMSMRVAKEAGIAVYEIHRKEERIETIYAPPEDYSPTNENPVEFIPTPPKGLNEPYAYAKIQGDEQRFMLVKRHASIGHKDSQTTDKYTFTLQPLNRLLMNAAKEGITLDPKSVYSHHCPTSRELVDFIGAGFTQLQITHKDKARDEYGLAALEQLTQAGILKLI